VIIIAYGQLWLLLAIWLAVVGCAFGLGWSGGRYTRPEPAPPPAPPSELKLCRSCGHRHFGRGPMNCPELDQADRTAIDIQRWWPGLERQARQETAPMTRADVEVSNWEKARRRDMDAWMHQRGMQ